MVQDKLLIVVCHFKLAVPLGGGARRRRSLWTLESRSEQEVRTVHQFTTKVKVA